MRFIKLVLIASLVLIIACGKDKTSEKQTNKQSDSNGTSTLLNTPNSQMPSNSSDWQMFMYDTAYRGVSPDKTLKPPLTLAWKYKTGGAVNSSPVVYKNTVYIGSDDQRLYALNADKWGLKWTFDTGGKITNAPTVYRDNVYFSSRDFKVYALDAFTGMKKWETQVDGWINSPLVASNDRIYVGCYENKIYILNALTGKKEGDERERISIGGVEFACIQGEFYPVDAYNRSLGWKNAIRRSESWPAIANGFAYIGSRDNRIYAFNAKTRQQVWYYEANGWIDSSPAIAGGKLFVGSRDGYVYAFKNGRNSELSSESSQGVVIHDKTLVYKEPQESPQLKMTQVNEGTALPVLGKSSGNWYLDPSSSWIKVRLPDDRIGWVEAENFIRTKQADGLTINASLVKDATKLNLPKDAETVSWSPDVANLAYFANVSYDNIYWMAQSLWIASGDGSDQKWISDGSFFNPNITWSSNGEWLAFENLNKTERQIWMVRYIGSGLRKITIGEAPSLSVKGDSLAFMRRENKLTSVWIRGLDKDKEQKIAEFRIKGQESFVAYGYNASLVPPSWSKDGLLLAVGLDGYHYDDKYARVVILKASGGTIKELAVRAWKIRNVNFSPDKKKIAFITQEHSEKQADESLDKQVHIATIDGEKKETFKHCEGFAWSPNGRYIAFVEENDTMGFIRKVWIFDTIKWLRIQLLSSNELIEKVVWLKDDTIMVLARADSPKPSDISQKLPKINCWKLTIPSLPR
jgi:outer membrane protein assembly factor BamB